MKLNSGRKRPGRHRRALITFGAAVAGVAAVSIWPDEPQPTNTVSSNYITANNSRFSALPRDKQAGILEKCFEDAKREGTSQQDFIYANKRISFRREHFNSGSIKAVPVSPDRAYILSGNDTIIVQLNSVLDDKGQKRNVSDPYAHLKAAILKGGCEYTAASAER